MLSSSPTPITVFTGFVGAGKTTTILSLLPRLPKGYNVCLLKNEFGDVEVDSQLAKQSNLTAVNEILNGCMCCVLVGQMKTALIEIQDKFQPDRIIVEASGSAFPATLAFQIRDLEREIPGGFKLDAIVTVVDAENFTGYEDTSPTAKMQASYTDIILINKWELVSERDLDLVLDHLHTLNDLTPKIKCDGKKGVDPNLIFGVDSNLFKASIETNLPAHTHNDEIEAVTVRRGTSSAIPSGPCCDQAHSSAHLHAHDPSELPCTAVELTDELLSSSLSTLSKEYIWRIKGFITLTSPPGSYILNWAFGRFDLTPYEGLEKGVRSDEAEVRLTVMGQRGEVKKSARVFARLLSANIV